MSENNMDADWRAAFGDQSARPKLYSSDQLNEEGFQPLTDPQKFIQPLGDLNAQQMYSAAANNQLAMKQAQDEYLELQRQIQTITMKGMDSFKDPQSFPSHDDFEERKEADLYGYKYEAGKPVLLHSGHPGVRAADEVTEQEKHDVRFLPDPFEQGGFIPKPKELKSITDKAKDLKNPDGWDPVIDKAGRHLIPKQQTHHDEYTHTYVKRNVDENGQYIRPVSPDSDAPKETPEKLGNKLLSRTRFDGKKVPATRDVSEAPSTASTPRGRKRGSPPGDYKREDTPSTKRPKVATDAALPTEAPPKRKGQNQYTKAREERERLARQQQAQGLANPLYAPQPSRTTASAPPNGHQTKSWLDMSTEEKRTRAWAEQDLKDAIREDHTWLNDDPKKAQKWATELLKPDKTAVRSFAMYKKWGYWRNEGLDKRPRAKDSKSRDGTPHPNGDDGDKYNPRPTSRKPRGSRALASGTATPMSTSTPAPDIAQQDGTVDDASTSPPKTRPVRAARTKSAIGVKDESRQGNTKTNGVSNGDHHSTPDQDTESSVDEKASTGSDSKQASRSSRRRPRIMHETSSSTIMVNSEPSQVDGSTPTKRVTRSTRNASS
jgi:hypothetical protein